MNPSKIPLISRSTIETKISIVGVEICGLVTILLIHLILLFNTRFTLWPEMVVYPYLLNNGFLLYRDIVNPYPPLFIWFLAFFAKIFGYTPSPYQILAWVLILASDVIIFIVVKKIFKSSHLALISTLFFAITSVSFGVNGLWFDLAQTPLILASFYFFYQFIINKGSNKDLFLSFAALALGFFVKQQIMILFIWFLAIIIFKFPKKPLKFSQILLIFAPLAILPFFSILLFSNQDNFSDFFYWIFYFPAVKSSQMSGYLSLPTPRQLAAVVSLFLIFAPTLVKNKAQTNLFLATSLIMLVFAYPRFDYFHLIPSLSVLSLAFGKNLQNLPQANNLAKFVFIASLVILSLFTGRYLKNNWTHEVRFFEKEIFEVASHLAKIIEPQEPIYIQNGPDQILPLSDRLPVKPWIDEFPWYLEIEGVQEQVSSALDGQKPRYIIFKPYEIGPRYQIGAYQPQKLASFIDENYKLDGQISQSLWLKVKD